VAVLFAPRLQALLATMQQQLATSAMLQATHQALMTRVNSATDLHHRRQQQQQQEEDYQPPPSPQQQQRELELSTAADMVQSSIPMISPGRNRCDSPAPSLAEVSMADMAVLGPAAAAAAAAAEQLVGSAQPPQQHRQPSPKSSSRLAMQSEGRDSGSQQQQQQPGLQQQQQQKERGAAGLPSNKLYGRSTVKGSRERERYLAPTGYL